MNIKELKAKKDDLDNFIVTNSSNLYRISFDSLIECIEKDESFNELKIIGRVREILKEAWRPNGGVPHEIVNNFNNFFKV